MVSWFEVEIAELRRSCRPIFMHSPEMVLVLFSIIEILVDIRNYSGPGIEATSSAPGGAFEISDIEID